MKNLKNFVNECRNDIESLGIELGDIADVTVNTRAKNRWGLCSKRQGKYYISISSQLLEDSVDDMSVKNTVAHELLHTIKDGMRHTGEWKSAANLLNDVYGYNIKRCTSYEEKGIERPKDKTRKSMQPKHKLRCTYCGYTYLYRKTTNTVKDIMYGRNKYYYCAVCSSRGSLEYVK